MQPSVDPSAVTTAMSSLSDVSKLHPSRPDTVGILKASLLDIPRAAAQTPKRPQSARSALSGPGSSVASVQRARKTPESRPRSANHTGVPRLSPATPRAGRSRPASAAVSARSSGPRD